MSSKAFHKYFSLLKLNFVAGATKFKANNRNNKKRCETRSKLIIKTPERRRSGVFIVNSEHIPYFLLVFPLLTSTMGMFSRLLTSNCFWNPLENPWTYRLIWGVRYASAQAKQENIITLSPVFTFIFQM